MTEHGAQGGFLPEQVTDLFPAWQVWRKPLHTPAGGQAVLVVNLSNRSQTVTVLFEQVDPSGRLGAAVRATDVWSGAAVGVDEDRAVFPSIAPHDSVFVVLSPK